MAIRLRQVTTASDLETWTRAVTRTFHFTGSIEDAIAFDRRRHEQGDRSTIAEIDREVAGTFRSFDAMLTLPGGAAVDVDAITGITVQSTHRRRGVLTRMMTADLARIAAGGRAAAILWSAEFPIYGRFGFGVATRSLGLTIDRTRAGFRHDAHQDAGTVRFASNEELFECAPAVFDDVRSRTPGEITRSRLKWEVETNVTPWPGDEWKGWHIVSRDERGRADGFASYHVDHLWEHGSPKQTLSVDALTSTSAQARSRLWRFLLGVDLVATVRADRLPLDELLPWQLEDGRAAVFELFPDGLWLRVLDPIALLSQRTLGASSVVVEIVDPAGFATGVFRVEQGNVKRLRRSTADLTIDVASLGTLILGTERAEVLHAAGRIDEHRRGAVERLDVLLRTAAPPHCSTGF